MRILGLLLLLGAVLSSTAQLIVKPIEKHSETRRGRITDAREIKPATLPFWDDFSISPDSPDGIRVWGQDTTSQWNAELSKDVFVNATLAINPPSYKVATFDGLDANGAFHGDGVGLTDQLVSDTINLQGTADVVLSFYWQAGGNVEIPEEGDSLVLQFYNPNADGEKWITEWLIDGKDAINGEDTIFTQQTIPISSQYLTQQFLFRFQSYGDQDGPFDAWHLDWIYLNDKRAEDDFFYEGEVSLNSDVSVFLSPYRSIPVDQITESNYLSDVAVSSMNLNPEPDNIGPPVNYLLTINEQNASNEITSGTTFTEDLTKFFNPNPLKVTMANNLNFSGLTFQSLEGRDSVVIEARVNTESTTTVDFLDGTNINLRINDTIRTQYLLHNYYAYDDGTAEYAAGTNINGAQVAVQFWVERPDTLTHVDIHFPNISPASTGSALSLKIYKTLEGDPLRDQNITVENGSKINEFARYKLSSPLVVSDTFYVGYEQSKNEYIGVGFDRSNEAASKYIYENKTGQWEQSTRLSGALMIRPVFESLDSLVLTTPLEPEHLHIYPNPTSGIIRVSGSYERVTLMDFSGKIWYQKDFQESHDFTNLRAGLYLLTIHRKEENQTIKIIKK